jgi:hypothetical protein
MKSNEFIVEKWSQKYKSSINCSHPKGFSQRAHCAGKKKHNESVEMEMVCEDCGMCETHGNILEIKKGQKDSNGYTKCWPGKHAEGTKKSAVTGKQVRNCQPNESISEENKGLYYNVNKRKKAGTSRDADSPLAPTAQAWKDAAKTAKKESVAEGYEPGDKITWYHSNHHPEIEGTVVGWKDGHLIVKSIDPQPRNTEKTVAKYRVPKNNILSHDKQGVAEAGNKPVEKSYFGMGDTRTPRDIKSQMRGASDRFVQSTADTATGPIHSKIAKMQTKMAKSELRKRSDHDRMATGTNEGVAEAEYNPDTFVGKKGTYKGYGITQEGPSQWGISSSVRKFSTLAAAKRHIDKVLVVSEQGVAEGLTENVYSLEQAHAIFDDFEQAMADRGLTEDIFNFFTDEEIILETAAWRRSAGKSKKGGLNAKGVASYRRENPGSKLQMAVTTKPSKLKPGSKAAKRRKSFCARMGGVKGPMKKPNGKPTRKALALRKWNC